MLNNCGVNEHLYLVPAFNWNGSNISFARVILTINSCYIFIAKLKNFTLLFTLLKVFIRVGHLILGNDSSLPNELIM